MVQKIFHLTGIFSTILLKFWTKKCQKMAQKAEFRLAHQAENSVKKIRQCTFLLNERRSSQTKSIFLGCCKGRRIKVFEKLICSCKMNRRSPFLSDIKTIHNSNTLIHCTGASCCLP